MCNDTCRCEHISIGVNTFMNGVKCEHGEYDVCGMSGSVKMYFTVETRQTLM